MLLLLYNKLRTIIPIIITLIIRSKNEGRNGVWWWVAVVLGPEVANVLGGGGGR